MPDPERSHSDQSQLKVMSFGEHLEELRSRLIRCILITVLGTIVALFFQEAIMRVISQPHLQAMSRVMGRQLVAKSAWDLDRVSTRLAALPEGAGAEVHRRYAELSRFTERREAVRASLEPRLGDEATRELLSLIAELQVEAERGSLFRQFQATLNELEALVKVPDDFPYGAREGLPEVEAPVARLGTILETWKKGTVGGESIDWSQLDRDLGDMVLVRNRLTDVRDRVIERTPLKALSYPESFFAHIKLCLLAGLLLGLPWTTIELWNFVAAGLYSREQKAVYPFIPFSLISFVAGSTFAYLVLVPVGLGYLGGYASPDLVEASFTLRDYISLIITLMLGMGLVFQLPLLMIFLNRAGIVTIDQFRKYRKISIFAAVVLGAFLTPPDPVTQLLMAGPLVILYQVGIWASQFTGKKAKETT